MSVHATSAQLEERAEELISLRLGLKGCGTEVLSALARLVRTRGRSTEADGDEDVTEELLFQQNLHHAGLTTGPS